MTHKFNYRWKLKDTVFTKDKGTVFSCFACGGGSTMGYKLAGFDVIGCNEIDPRMMNAYCCNHNPKFPFLEPIQTFKDKQDLPPELFNLDILDGSPPCSTFSMVGSREEAWGKMKKFREGQAEQVLDTLFFDFVQLAKRLQPKVIVAENVEGLMLGQARQYLDKILKGFSQAGYYVLLYLLDAQYMGVPQRRKRLFFVCLRKDFAPLVPCNRTLFGEALPILNLNFTEKRIPFSKCYDGKGRYLTQGSLLLERWGKRQLGDGDISYITKRTENKNTCFNQQFVYMDKVCNTITSKEDSNILFTEPKYLSQSEVCCVSTFPQDYDFMGAKPFYICGMSVPPVMMAQIASRIYDQWLVKIHHFI